MKTLEDTITVYFSYNRPMQLDLALTTNQIYSASWEDQKETVLYKADNERYAKAYKKLAEAHPSISFIEEKSFKKDLLEILKDSRCVMFVVDDCIFTREYSLRKIIDVLDNVKEGIGFSLRLGKNTTYCYPLSVKNDVPELLSIGYDVKMRVFDWTFPQIGDFAYPLEVSSSVYRTQNLRTLLENCNYENPNELEYMLSLNLKLYSERLSYCFCYDKSVAFCNPINKVKESNKNRAGSYKKYSLDYLLEKYEKGYEIDYSKFENFTSNGCHQEVEVEFIRSSLDKS